MPAIPVPSDPQPDQHRPIPSVDSGLRSFRWGHVRQLDRVSREALARAWDAGVGPGDDPLTIDLDSTVCETYGLGKEGAQRHNYAGQRGLSPAVGRGRGQWSAYGGLMARLRQGIANTARGVTNFLRETVSRVRHAGATGPLTVRADSGCYTHPIVVACRGGSSGAPTIWQGRWPIMEYADRRSSAVVAARCRMRTYSTSARSPRHFLSPS